MEGWAEAVARKDRKVFLEKGQPQWRTEARSVGLSIEIEQSEF